MSEDEFAKIVKKKQNICTIIQRKFNCQCICVKNGKPTFTGFNDLCTAVDVLYKEQENNCLDCELNKDAHRPKEWEH